MNTKVYCKDCSRFYITGANQCEIPDGGLHLINNETPEDELFFLVAKGDLDMDQIRFINKKLKHIHRTVSEPNKIFGKPSELNVENDCIFYKGEDKDKDKVDLKVKFLNSFLDMLMFMVVILLIISMIK